MTLIKTSLLNGIAVVIKLLTLLGINKILAIYVGPAGYAALGQFQNIIQIITTFASGAINTGVTKYTAEYHDNEEKQHQIWQTAGKITLIGSIITSIFIALFSKPLSIWLLHDEYYHYVFIWFAITLIFFTFNTLLLAILNGKKDILRYVVANIAGSLITLIITSIMVIKYNLYGALIALAVYQSVAFFVTLLICYKATWFKISYLFGKIDREVTVNLAKFTAMAMTSAICVPVSHILIRNHLGTTLGWEAAGYWEAMWRVSAAYLMLATTTFSVYYLPRLAELKTLPEIKKEILQGYSIILPITALSGLIMYLMRDYVILTLFTKNFLPIRELFIWQMIGDTLKIGSWMISYLMLSKAMTKLFISTEIIFTTSFVILAHVLTDYFNINGVMISYTLNYAIYLFIMSFLIFRYLGKRENIYD